LMIFCVMMFSRRSPELSKRTMDRGAPLPPARASGSGRSLCDESLHNRAKAAGATRSARRDTPDWSSRQNGIPWRLFSRKRRRHPNSHPPVTTPISLGHDHRDDSLECAPTARPGYHIIRVPPAHKYTVKQGQYLAFIYYYTKIHGIAPAEADIQHYFGVTAPSIHQMILTLEKQGFITRTPGAARSISIMVPRSELPDLE
jgi:hypothetical protein